MFNIIVRARYYITRIMLRVQGIAVKEQCNKVKEIWSHSESEYYSFVKSCIRKSNIVSASGQSIDKISDILSEPTLSKVQLNKISKRNGKPKNARFYRHTAGTTGEPTHIWLNKLELSKMLGVREYCFRHYGIRVGDREARLWGRSESGAKNSIKNFLLNRRIFHPVGKPSLDEIKALVKWKPSYIYGYSSLIIEAANIIKNNNIKVHYPKCVICTAESILPSQKKFISEVFCCPVAEEYGSTEFDIIAFECVSNHLHLVNPWLFVEKIDNEIVISDVSRRSQNIIRYEIGDALSLKKTDCGVLGGKTVVEVIKGRATNQLAYAINQEPFHGVEFSHAIDSYLKEMSDNFRFSIVQNNLDAFYIDTDPDPIAGMDNLCRFIEQYIFKSTGLSIVVKKDLSNSLKLPGNKQAYFVQSMRKLY